MLWLIELLQSLRLQKSLNRRRDICFRAVSQASQIANSARADVMAVIDRDPACNRYMQPLLYFKGFLAVQAYRVSNWLWTDGQKDLAYFFQMRTSEVFGIDIHPAANIGKGLMIDHAHSIVVGETLLLVIMYLCFILLR